MKFVIVSPRQAGGGPIVLHLLCKLLMQKGYDAKIFYVGPTSMKGISYFRYWLKYIGFIYRDVSRFIKVKLFPKKYAGYHHYEGYVNEAVKGCQRKFFPIIDDDTVVVYPEIIWGNPLNAKKIVRWFLSFNPYVGEGGAYGKDELVFSFREIFNDNSLNPQCKLLQIVNYDHDLYRQYNFSTRDGKCYIIRKGKDRQDLPSKMDGPVIDTMSEKEIVKVFNTCKYCVSYDTQTFYTSIAAMCGCIPVVVTEPGKARNDYIGKEDQVYGVAYGWDEAEIKFAIETRTLLAERIREFDERNEYAVASFIRECEINFRG